MPTVNWREWLIAAVVGPTLATLVMLGILRLDSDPLDWSVLVLGPVLLGAVFTRCARATIGLSRRRAAYLLSGFVAAQVLAFFVFVGAFRGAVELGARAYGISPFIIPFFYGASFALAAGGVLSWLFPTTRNKWRIAATVLAAGLAALIYRPLQDLFPAEYFAEEPILITFGIVYAVVAAVFGWRLFATSPTRTD